MSDKKISVLAAISQTLPQLTKAEQRIATYIRDNPQSVISMPVSELSEASNTAPSAVVRCCRSLGFAGYTELKLALAVELSQNERSGYTPYINPDDLSTQILEKVFTAGIKTLSDTMSSIDSEKFAKAVDLLANARHIYVFGVGTSAPLVNDFAYRLMQIGCYAMSITDVPSMMISTLNIDENDAAIAISHSGRTNPTIEAITLAGSKGAKTVALTSAPGSPLVNACDIPLVISTDEIRYPIEAISARIGHICLIDSIVTSISAKNYPKALERSKLTHEIVDSTIRKK